MLIVTTSFSSALVFFNVSTDIFKFGAVSTI